MNHLEEYMSVSARTIRRDLKDITEILKRYNLSLERGNDQVFYIQGSDSDKQSFKWQLLDLSYNEFTPLERQQFILKTLLKEEVVKLISLANDLSVTVSTISNDLTKLEDELPEGVGIERRRGSGIWLRGDEFKKRVLLSDIIAEQFPQKILFTLFQEKDEIGKLVDERLLHLIDKELILNVEQRVRNWRANLHYKMTDEAYLALVIHITVSVQRMLTGHYLENKNTNEFEAYPEFQMAKSLLAECLEVEEVVPVSEIIYVTMHFRSAKSTDFNETDFLGNEHLLAVKISKQLIRRVEQRIKRSFKEGTLLKGLTAHLRPALRRLNGNMRIHNPLVISIKEDYPMLFDVVKEEFTAIYGGMVPEEEIGYLVLHFGAALLSLEEKTSFSGIVICASGIGTSRMLVTRLKQAIPKLKKLETVSLFEWKQKAENYPFDVIISTIDLGNVPFDYFLVSPMLSEREVSRIELYLRDKGSTFYHYNDASKEQQLTMLEAIHHLENRQVYTETVLDILKNFQVVKINQVSHHLKDMLRAILTRMMEKEQKMQVEVLLKSFFSRTKWNGFGIDGTKMALFHARNQSITRPLFQIFSLSEGIEVSTMNGKMMVAETFIVMLAPEKFSKQGLEVLSYVSSLLIENEETVAIFENGDVKEITQYMIYKLNQFLDENK
ncbi:BglG family transcription antiterminator [Listeria sp. PSOL-1]|uniref:BglG family transcription antiterminator n=1 Tax=Listeria sp. PSOL-1 TaxID=1844999 RepID=UPI001E2A88DE